MDFNDFRDFPATVGFSETRLRAANPRGGGRTDAGRGGIAAFGTAS